MNRMATMGLAATTGFMAAIVLWGAKISPFHTQPEGDRVALQAKADVVLLSIEVTDTLGRRVIGLQPKDFRIVEDGVAQKVGTFAEGLQPFVQVLADGSTRPLSSEASQKQSAAFDSIQWTSENSYNLTYDPAPNDNRGFRKIEVRILGDAGWIYRVRHKAGYRP